MLGVILDEISGGELMLDHRVVRNSLRREREDDQLVGVFRRQEALWNRVEHVDRREQQRAGKIHRRAPMTHHPRQAALITVEHPIEPALGDRVKFAVALAARRPQKARAQHRRQSQRHESRNEDRGADRDRELMQQAPENPAHEQHRDEHRGEREGHRQDREPDFLRAVERRRHHVLAHLHVAHDVLEHDDRVVDDEADARA